MNQATIDFIRANAKADVRQLALQGTKNPEVDLTFALEQIAGRQKAKTKLPSWATIDGIVYPPHLSMEQCSSEQTARYKALIAGKGALIVDLTAGFGVDMAFISQNYQKAVHVERQAPLCAISSQNYKLLGLNHIEVVCADKMQPTFDEWASLVGEAKGGAIKVDVFAQHGDQWTHYKPFSIFVSPDSIDSYLSYRLIFPSFISYEALTINQRCLENYDEGVIYDNVLCSFEKDGQCINCHHYQQYNPKRMQFHARQNKGGTVIAYDGKIKKINMKNDSILSAGVYPAWHPWLNLIVYSTNKTAQDFHTVDHN